MRTSEQASLQEVPVDVVCPYCSKLSTFSIPVRGGRAAAKSLWNTAWFARISGFGPLGLGLFLVPDGWKMAVMVTGVSYVIVPLLDRLFSVFLAAIFRTGKPLGDLSVVVVTVGLSCPNPECGNPDPERRFQVRVGLPLSRTHNSLRVDSGIKLVV